MTPLRRQDTRERPRASVRRQTPLKSVSTRIVLCVFVSTLLTALIVSWLAVGAIHRDVRSRVADRAERVLRDRSRELEHWQAEAEASLTSAVASGAWRRAVLARLRDRSEAPRFGWRAEVPADEDDARGLTTLPDPPESLRRHFERLDLLRVGDATAEAMETPPGCLAARVGLGDARGDRVAELTGCLARDPLAALLHPRNGDERGFRILLVDAAGGVAVAAGARAEDRRGALLPIEQLYSGGVGGSDEGHPLVRYHDEAGDDLVGAIVAVGVAGWSLVAEAERSRAFAPALEITRQIFVVDVCIILLFSVLAHKVTQAIMKPIEALSEGARRIAEGHVDYEIPVPPTDDELGLLTRTFNSMMSRLRSNQLEIEQDKLRLEEKNEELQRANEILAQLSITDGLTKLHNHRYFQDHLTREIKRVSRTRAPLSLILIDIDDFKQLNDTHGHAAGDEVLVSLAAIMNDSARESDLIARYGGEEFVILMPNTDLAGAVHLAEKIRMAVESTRLIVGDNMRPIDVTISLGVALFKGDRRDFFAQADRALYQAKAAGKNCVIIAGSEPPSPAIDPEPGDAPRPCAEGEPTPDR